MDAIQEAVQHAKHQTSLSQKYIDIFRGCLKKAIELTTIFNICENVECFAC